MAKKLLDIHDHLIGFSPNIKEDSSNGRLYNLVSNYLSNGYCVIYAAESLVSSSFATEYGERIKEQGRHEAYAILKYLANHIGANKVNAYLKRGLLTIKDPDDILDAGSTVKQLLNSLNSLIQNYEPKLSDGIKGKAFFNSPSNFFQEGKFDKFLEFEHMIGKKFNDDFQMICWYRKKWIQTLSFSQLVRLLEVHNRTIHNNAEFQTWNAARTLEVISEGINKAVDQDHASDIIFETMHRRFNLDKSIIMSSPNLFADTLRTMSPDSAETIIDTAMEEFENRLSFDNYDRTTKKSTMHERKGRGLRGTKIGRRSNSGNSSSKKNSSSTSKSRTPRGRKERKAEDHNIR